MAVILQASSFLTSLDTTQESIAGLEGKLCTGVNSSCRVRGLRARAHRRVSSQTRHRLEKVVKNSLTQKP